MEQRNDKWLISHQSSKIMVRTMAGFPTYGRFFYLARSALNPHTSLCKKLFPAIGEWHDRLAAQELNPGNPIQPTVAENAFVQIGYDDDDGNRDDDDANDDSTTASCRPKRLFLKFLNNLVVQVTNKSIPILCPYPSATITDTFTQLGRLCPPPIAYFLQQFSHSHYNSLLPLDISLTTTPNIACTIAL
ncbi:hypothetical protein [Absidia glauca]|uniref:Ndc10 domain-containing protein n=1 Tax=Absidia glauca TaxID=4829 RepID=A0A163JWK0_ABSGL|nr:hypothetical protein [Absidia glauca]